MPRPSSRALCALEPPPSFLIQKEVADRISRPTRLEGLRLLLRRNPALRPPHPALHRQTRAPSGLPRSSIPPSFNSRPKPPAPDALDPEPFLAFVSKAFRHKRKTLRNNLAPFYPKELLDPQPELSRRAEQIAPAEFAALYRRLSNITIDEGSHPGDNRPPPRTRSPSQALESLLTRSPPSTAIFSPIGAIDPPMAAQEAVIFLARQLRSHRQHCPRHAPP